MKKISLFIAVIVTLVLVFISDNFSDVFDEFIPTPTPFTVSPYPTPAAAHGGKFVTVLDVVDGDTIKVDGGEIVRYIGVNTPETVAPGRPVECYGPQASKKNTELVQGKVVELEKDISERDVFGRLLRYVWLDGRMVNETLVREGFAQVATYPPDVKYQEVFIEAQTSARENKKGLWGDICFTNVATPSATIAH